jgi:hypothetical protein
MVEAERQLEPDPQYARHHLDDLFGAGMIFKGVSQRLDRGLNSVCFRMHCPVSPMIAIGLAALSAPRQPKNRRDVEKNTGDAGSATAKGGVSPCAAGAACRLRRMATLRQIERRSSGGPDVGKEGVDFRT